MTLTKFTFFLFAFFLTVNSALAQSKAANTKTDLDFGVGIYSRYVWRGTRYGGDSPNIQPEIKFSYNNFEIQAWGAYSTGGINSFQETDLILQYSFIHDMFTAVISDYYFLNENRDYNYFNYRKDSTGHLFEGGLCFNGTKKLPLTLNAYFNFYGADAVRLGNNPSDTATFNKKTGIQFSDYFELGYNLTIKTTDLNFFLGFTFSNPKKPDSSTGFIGEKGFYGNNAGVVNIGFTVSKSIKITKNYSIGLNSSLLANPETERVFLVFGIDL